MGGSSGCGLHSLCRPLSHFHTRPTPTQPQFHRGCKHPVWPAFTSLLLMEDPAGSICLAKFQSSAHTVTATGLRKGRGPAPCGSPKRREAPPILFHTNINDPGWPHNKHAYNQIYQWTPPLLMNKDKKYNQFLLLFLNLCFWQRKYIN